MFLTRTRARPGLFGLIAALTVAGCAEEPPRGELEIKHCRLALTFLNRNLGTTTVVSERFWEGDRTLNVAVTYDVVIPGPNQRPGPAKREVIQCRYALTPSNPNARMEMVGLRQRGVELDKEQIRIVNIGMRVFR